MDRETLKEMTRCKRRSMDDRFDIIETAITCGVTAKIEKELDDSDWQVKMMKDDSSDRLYDHLAREFGTSIKAFDVVQTAYTTQIPVQKLKQALRILGVKINE